MILATFLTTKTAMTFLFVTLAVLIGMIIYKRIIGKMKQGEVNMNDFCVLYSLEKNEHTGELEFYFTNEKPKKVVFEILSESEEVLHKLVDKEYQKGGHIIRFDSKELANGTYFYQLRTDNQQTKKRLVINNV
jgi:hypothetical protein